MSILDSCNGVKKNSLCREVLRPILLNDSRVHPIDISVSAPGAGEEQILPIRREHRTVLGRLGVDGWAHVLGLAPSSILTSETDVEIGSSQTVRSATG